MNTKIAALKSLKMLNEELLEIIYEDNIKVTLKDVTEVYEELYKQSENKRVARLLIMGNGIAITNAARQAIADENRQNKDLIIAEAIIVNSFYQKINANFYLRFTKRKFPAQCFTEVPIAMEWLNKMIKKDKKKQ